MGSVLAARRVSLLLSAVLVAQTVLLPQVALCVEADGRAHVERIDARCCHDEHPTSGPLRLSQPEQCGDACTDEPLRVPAASISRARLLDFGVVACTAPHLAGLPVGPTLGRDARGRLDRLDRAGPHLTTVRRC